jgi:hypothetical protein
MNDVVTFEFYSDTNLEGAFDELQLMSLDVLSKEADTIAVGIDDWRAFEDSIATIVSANGGELVG